MYLKILEKDCSHLLILISFFVVNLGIIGPAIAALPVRLQHLRTYICISTYRYVCSCSPLLHTQVGDYSLACHTCVLAGRSDVLLSLLEKSRSVEADHATPTLDVAQAFDLSCVRSTSLLLFVDYLYSVETSFTIHVHRREHAQRSLSEDTSSEPPPQRSVLEGEEQEEAVLFTRAASHADFMGFCELLSKTHVAGVGDMDRLVVTQWTTCCVHKTL